MVRVIKSVSLDSEIYEDINNKKKEFGFIFSDWVSKKYHEEFFDVNNKKEEIKQAEQRIELLKKEITVIEQREKTYADILSRAEKRFIMEVPRLISEGKNISSLTARFNASFNRKFTFEEFNKMVVSLAKRPR